MRAGPRALPVPLQGQARLQAPLRPRLRLQVLTPEQYHPARAQERPQEPHQPVHSPQQERSLEQVVAGPEQLSPPEPESEQQPVP